MGPACVNLRDEIVLCDDRQISVFDSEISVFIANADRFVFDDACVCEQEIV